MTAPEAVGPSTPERPLIHLVHVSAATRSLGRPEVLSLLATAHQTNAPLGVTGILLYVEETFFQVLEGSLDVVVPLFAKIGRDNRHSRVLA